ncbi:MAG: helix-turn-helix transcriptional regulator [Actinomycetota bacterium]
MPSRIKAEHLGPAKAAKSRRLPSKSSNSKTKSRPAKTSKRPPADRVLGDQGKLPAAVSSFVGRRLEMTRLSKLLVASRLVTLTGPGGMGKTRLAIRLAGEAEGFAAGKWLVQLASLTDSGLVLRAVASALGVSQQRGGAPQDLIAAHLADGCGLVVLDNCEQVIEGAAEAAAALLAACPGLKIIATSRESLGIPGEKVSRLNALSVPPAPKASASKTPALRSVARYEAVRLFVERAKETQPTFALTKDVAPAVGEICRRLEGTPLAIELAAARVNALSPAQIAERLDDRFRLLTGGSRSATPRHQSLEAALAWSYDLLSDSEKALFRRLSVFPAGCTLEAAEAVCSGETKLVGKIVDLLAGLVAKSLLTFEPAGLYPRYRLLETVRHYAADRLAESTEQPLMKAAQAAWFLALAEQAEPLLVGPDQQSWLQRLEADYGNLLAAVNWAMVNDTEAALRLAAALSVFWRTRGYFKEGAELVHDVLNRTEGVRSKARAAALSAAASLDVMMGHSAASAPLLQESLELARELNDSKAEARALGGQGFLALNLQGPAAALPLLEQASALAGETGDDWTLLSALAGCWRAHMFHGDPAKARRSLEQCMGVARRIRDRRALADALYGQGWAALCQGDLKSAEEYLGQALSATEEWGERYETALVLGLLGEVARVRDDHETATDLFERALELSREMSANFPLARALVGLGKVAVAQDNLADARELLNEAEALSGQANLSFLIAPALHGLAELAQATGNPAEAKEKYEEALAVARRFEDKVSIAGSLYELARIARRESDHDQARLFNREALGMRANIGDQLGVAASLTSSAGLAIDQDEYVAAARMLGAANSLRRLSGLPEVTTTWPGPKQKADLKALKKALPAGEFKSAWEEGRRMNMKEAVAYASRGQGARGRPASGLASLTPSEKAVAALVQEGLSNAEISERLFISPRTVQAHLSHIFTKLDINSRRDLRRVLALKAGPH